VWKYDDVSQRQYRKDHRRLAWLVVVRTAHDQPNFQSYVRDGGLDASDAIAMNTESSATTMV
jgi:hypothetical protein